MKGKRLLYILRKAMMAILVLLLIILILFLIEDPIKTLQDLLALASINPVMTIITLWLLYAFKSLTIFFPLLVLEIATGHLFSPMTAAIVIFKAIASPTTKPNSKLCCHAQVVKTTHKPNIKPMQSPVSVSFPIYDQPLLKETCPVDIPRTIIVIL